MLNYNTYCPNVRKIEQIPFEFYLFNVSASSEKVIQGDNANENILLLK